MYGLLFGEALLNDMIMMIVFMVCMKGQKKIYQSKQWRTIKDTTGRHLVTNFGDIKFTSISKIFFFSILIGATGAILCSFFLKKQREMYPMVKRKKVVKQFDMKNSPKMNEEKDDERVNPK